MRDALVTASLLVLAWALGGVLVSALAVAGLVP